ncbi:sensor histidine kinase [Halocola ammonii]
MKRRKYLYWPAQVFGWLLFVLVVLFRAFLTPGELNREAVISAGLIFVFGILISHTFRLVLHKLQWERKGVLFLFPRVILSAVLMGTILILLYGSISDLFLPTIAPILDFDDLELLVYISNFSFPFLMWLTIYFTVKAFENFKREEIEKLELKAANSEMELNSFKAQMNPHFMFNSMNSIRALIDDQPADAKEAITLLSSMLRNTLLLGRKSTVALSEELDVVQKYLSIEQIRFEERLKVEVEVEPGVLELQVPPLMIQTIVENAVKHGISRQKFGGVVSIKAWRKNGELKIEVANSGKLKKQKGESGFGIANTKKRLELLFGDKATFELNEVEDKVVALLTIPIQTSKHHEDSNS